MDRDRIIEELDTIVREADSLPTNSESLLIDESSSRFSGAIWADKIREQSVTLAGIGGIGRFGNLINFYYLCT